MLICLKLDYTNLMQIEQHSVRSLNLFTFEDLNDTIILNKEEMRMNLNELKQEVIDLRNEMKTQVDKYLELVNENHVLDFSEIWTDGVREYLAELFVEDTSNELSETCLKNDAFIEDEKYVSLEASKFFHVYSDNLRFEDDLTFETFIRYTAADEYPDSNLIGYLYKDDDSIESLLDELDAEGVLDDSRIDFELEQIKELLDTVKKTVVQLTTVKDEIKELNSCMTEFFYEFCESYEELKYRHV